MCVKIHYWRIYYLGMPDIPDIFYWVSSRCWVEAYVCRVPPPPPPPPTPPTWAETTHDRNDSRPKRPTKIGRIDTPKSGRNDPGRNDPADTTHGRNDPDSLYPKVHVICKCRDKGDAAIKKGLSILVKTTVFSLKKHQLKHPSDLILTLQSGYRSIQYLLVSRDEYLEGKTCKQR